MLPFSIAAEENQKSEAFKDVETFKKYETEINQLVDLGIIKGFPDQTFRPNAQITRAQGVAMIIREKKLDTSNRPDPQFKDLKSDYLFYDEIATAVDEGIIDGFQDGTFRAGAEMTRGQMAKILVGAYDLKLIEDNIHHFKDVAASNWAYDYINILASNGITLGYDDGTFKSGKTLTRLHFSLFLSRYINDVQNNQQDDGQNNQQDVDAIKGKFELKANSTDVYFGQWGLLELKYSGDSDLSYTTNWKATSGKLNVAEDGKSAKWSAERAVTEDNTVTVTIEVALESGEKITFDKSVILSTVIPIDNSNGDSSEEETPEESTPEAPVVKGEWVYNESTDEPAWKLTWEKTQHADSYKVYRAKIGEEYSLIGTLTDKDQVSFEDTEQEGSSSYQYKVIAYNGNSNSKDSNEVYLQAGEDQDEDQLPDRYEVKIKTNPLKNDSDEDGTLDGQEDEDQDSLDTYTEMLIMTDPYAKDSDQDGLTDAFEYLQTETDPNALDTDESGVEDGQEDHDSDTLTNLKEQELKTNPRDADTDSDELQDRKEIEMGTNPLEYDTDQDKLSDGEEEPLGFKPLNPDTDGDQILDGDEMVPYVTSPSKADQGEKVQPTVSIDAPASEGRTTSIIKMDTHPLLTDQIPGYIAPAYEFDTSVSFSEATMTFTYDESVVTEEFRPEIYYFNEEKQLLEKVENQTHDPETNTVTATVAHFSTYILLNGVDWDRAWEREIHPPAIDDSGSIKRLDIVFSIDSSGSMSSNDPNGLRKTMTENFISKLGEKDRAAVVDFDYSATLLQGLTTDHPAAVNAVKEIDSSGGTHLYRGVKAAVDELVANSSDEATKYIIFLTDGSGSWDDSVLEEAKANNIVIYTIGLGSGVNQTLLNKIAETTGGKYYFASDASELELILENTVKDTVDYTKDEDEGVGDGIPDYLENEEGLRVGLGYTIKPDANLVDTDGDGLTDGEEISVHYNEAEGKIYFEMYSNPLVVDTDNDGIDDPDEPLEKRNDYAVSPKESLMFSELSYVDLENHLKRDGFFSFPSIYLLDEEVRDKLGSHFNHADTQGWTVIAADDNEMFGTGFSAVAIKKGDKIVIAYRGSDEPGIASINDWIGNNVGGILAKGTNAQVPKAKDFTAKVIHDYPGHDIYVTGHSLGGFLAQAVSYHLINNTIANELSNGSSAYRSNVQQSLAKGAYQFTRTFNAAPFFATDALKPLGTDVPVSTDPEFNLSELENSKYDRYIFNHEMSFDLLRVLGENLSGEKLGKEFVYNSIGKTPEDFNIGLLTFVSTVYESVISEYSDDSMTSFLTEFGYSYGLVRSSAWLLEKFSDEEPLTLFEEFEGSFGDLTNQHSLHNFHSYLGKMKQNELNQINP
jgi:Mg-chelatase subunit ChlD